MKDLKDRNSLTDEQLIDDIHDWYTMEPNKWYPIENTRDEEVKRVPGGWIHRTVSTRIGAEYCSECLIPYSEDLKKYKKK